MNNFNYQLNKLELEIIQLLQQSQMPIGIYYLLMSKITKDLELMYEQQIQMESLNEQESQMTDFGQNVMMGPEPPQGFTIESDETEETE